MGVVVGMASTRCDRQRNEILASVGRVTATAVCIRERKKEVLQIDIRPRKQKRAQ